MVLRIADGATLFDTDLDAIIAAIGGTGVASGLATSASSPTPDMNVHVEAGEYYVNGDRISIGTSTTLAVGPADAANPRLDIVVGDSAGVLRLVAGTPAAAPSPPDLPPDSVLLAEVYVAAGVTQVTSADVADRRVMVGALADALRFASSGDNGKRALIGSATTGTTESSGGTPPLYWATASVTFSPAFIATPIVLAFQAGGGNAWAFASSPTATGVVLYAMSTQSGQVTGRRIDWMAIGTA